jgi:hypothetical protein
VSAVSLAVPAVLTSAQPPSSPCPRGEGCGASVADRVVLAVSTDDPGGGYVPPEGSAIVGFFSSAQTLLGVTVGVVAVVLFLMHWWSERRSHEGRPRRPDGAGATGGGAVGPQGPARPHTEEPEVE